MVLSRRADRCGGDGRVSRGGVDAALVSNSSLCLSSRVAVRVPSMAPRVVRGVLGVVCLALGVLRLGARSALARLSPIRVPSSRFGAAFTTFQHIHLDNSTGFVEGDVFWTLYPDYELSY